MKSFSYFKYGMLVCSLAMLAACSDSSSSSSDDGAESSSSATEISMSSVSEVSPVEISGLGATVSSDGVGGEQLKISGSIKMDYAFRVENREDEDLFFNIDSMKFVIGRIDNGKIYKSDLAVTFNATFPTDRVTLATAVTPVSLASIPECGDFRLYVDVYASVDSTTIPEGSSAEGLPIYLSRDSSDFEKVCAVEISSSSVVETCTELSSVEFTLSNKLATDQIAINLLSGTTDNPHFTLEANSEEAYFVAAAGVEFWEEENQTAGLLPDSPVCAEDFKTIYGSKQTRLKVDEYQNTWFIVKTADGEFPMMVGKTSFQGSGAAVVFTYYKK